LLQRQKNIVCNTIIITVLLLKKKRKDKEYTMAICYLNSDYNNKYSCNYEIHDSGIDVTVDYDITDEIKAIDGVKAFGNNTEFANRDILIVDSNNKHNYLVKDAVYFGHSMVYGTPDGGCKTKFHSYKFLCNGDPNKLSQLLPQPKVKKIRLYSKAIDKLIGYPSLTITTSKKEYIINLKKGASPRTISIGINNIKTISVDDSWSVDTEYNNSENILIDFSAYVEIELFKRTNLNTINEYINELIVFLQLYYPDQFIISKIVVLVDNDYYQINTPTLEIRENSNRNSRAVNCDILDFLKKCYSSIPYRKGKPEVRNIPYLIIKSSRSIEDNFLMFYRFIECYYKKQTIDGIEKSFISYSIKNNYISNNKTISENIDYLSQEIVCLRNKYVHSGYYLKNNCLGIKFNDRDKQSHHDNYTVNNVDIKWIFERTDILYDIAIDIVFKNMLGFEKYTFNRRF